MLKLVYKDNKAYFSVYYYANILILYSICAFEVGPQILIVASNRFIVGLQSQEVIRGSDIVIAHQKIRDLHSSGVVEFR